MISHISMSGKCLYRAKIGGDRFHSEYDQAAVGHKAIKR